MLFPVTIRSSDPPNKTLICFHVERHKSRIMHKENCQFLQVHKGPNPPNQKFTTFVAGKGLRLVINNIPYETETGK